MCDIPELSSTAPPPVASTADQAGHISDVMDDAVPVLAEAKSKRHKVKRGRSLDALDDIHHGDNEDASVTKKMRRVPVTGKKRGRKPKDGGAANPVSVTVNSASTSCTVSTQTDCLDHDISSPLSPLGVTPPTTDIAMLTNMVFQSVAAEVAPLSVEMQTMKCELQQLRACVVNLSIQISEMSSTQTVQSQSNSRFYINPHNCDELGSLLSHQSQLLEDSESSYAAAAAASASAPSQSRPTSSDGRQQAVRTNRSVRDAQRDAVSAMYVDLNMKQRRASNIVISGLPPADNDAAAVNELLNEEFAWDVDEWPGATVVRCRRLGRLQEDKFQPLLVTLDTRQQAEYFVKNAKFLRGSDSRTVRSNVYINSDQTPSEAKAAYDLREQRRQRAQRQQDSVDVQSAKSNAGRTFYRSQTSAPMAVDHEQSNTVEASADRPIRLHWRQAAPSSAASTTVQMSAATISTPASRPGQNILAPLSKPLPVTLQSVTSTVSASTSNVPPPPAGRPVNVQTSC